jgi:regulator of sigma E protease
LPFGGFVRMSGEDPDAGELDVRNQGAFYVKSKRARLGIIVAGAVMNFIFGAIAFGVLYTKSGIPEYFGHILIERVAEGSPAEEAGLSVGEKIIGVVIEGQNVAVADFEQLSGVLEPVQGKKVGILLDGGVIREVYVRTDNEKPKDQGRIGVGGADHTMKQYPLWQMPFRGMWIGTKAAVNFGVFLLESLGKMFYDMIFMGIVPKDVAGPVGIVHMAQKENLLTSGWEMILNFAAILSINLGVVNLLPIPALDGGRAVFVLLEGFIKKERLTWLEKRANALGMILLLLMIVAVSVRDVRVWVGETSWWQNLKK